MRLTIKTIFFSVVFLVIGSVQSNAQSSVYEAIRQNPNLQRLEEAIINANLRTRFSQNNEAFTIFAPTNAAMATIPSSIINNQALIEDLILTHSVSGYYKNFDFVDDAAVHTINNRDLIIDRNANGLFINGAKVIVTDIITNNGIVHIIDTWVPKSGTSETTLWSIINRSSKHKVLSTIIKEADFEDLYLQDEKKTVFIPTDEAYFSLSQERFDRLLGGNLNYIKNNLEFHIVEDELFFEDLANGAKFTAANTQELTITVNINGTYINGAKIQFSAITAVNGRVYVIEKVLLPADLPPFTFVDFVAQSEDHTSLENAITSAGLIGDLSADGTRTYFAPTDEAFALLDPQWLLNLFADTDSLRSVLLNHVLATRRNEENLIDVEMDMAINGYDLTFDEKSNGVFVDDARIILKDIPVDNGIVHVIDVVLVEIIEPFTVYDIISTHDSLTRYNFYVLKHNFDEILNQPGPYTVFAPSDDAIDMMPEQFLEDLNSITPDLLDDLVRSHVVEGFETSDSLTIDRDFLAFNGFGLTVGTDSLSNLFLNQSGIVVTNLFADNGVVHIIDAVVNPLDTFVTIFDFISQSPIHNTLESLVRISSIRDILDSPGAQTFFAPTDDAFSNLPTSVLSDILGDPNGLLLDVLLRHAVPGNVTSAELEMLTEITNSNLDVLGIEVINGEIFINDAKIIVRDVVLDNGIVHVIDALIGQAEIVNTVFDVIVNSENHGQLETLILFADFDDDLTLENNLTVFAPTDNAFNALPQSVLDQLMSIDTDFLLNVLNLHKHNDLALTSTFFNGRKLLMANGEEVTIEIVNNEVFVNNAKIVTQDILADNGIVHVVDALIMTPVNLKNVYEIVSTESNLTTMKKAVDAASLDDELTNETDITLFAPSDEAFEALPDGVLDELLTNSTSDLIDILLKHKHNSILLSTDFVNGERILMANGEETTIIIKSNGPFINNAKIEITDIIAENGVVHVIDAVLYTPPQMTTTVYDIVSDNENLSFLKDAVLAAGLRTNLVETDDITLFAPTNEAFNALPSEILTAFFNDASGLLRNTLMNHIHGNEIASTDMTSGQTLSMSGGNTSTLTVGNGIIRIDNAFLTIRDIQADNGIVHIIDSVLDLPNDNRMTVYDIIVESTDHSILENAIIDANLVGELNGDDLVTVFAPTNTAFSNLPTGLWTQLNADPNGLLRDVLSGHIINSQVISNNLINGSFVTVANGDQVQVTISNGSIFFGNARITIEDIQADNGTVHVVDAVVLPDGLITTVFDLIADSPNHTIFEELLRISGLNTTLSGPGIFTVFAPNNAAINSLGPDGVNDLINDTNGLLNDMLLYHITNSEYTGLDLTDGLEITMSNGIAARIANDGFNTFIEQGWILKFDLLADNGRVHEISKFISPITSTTTLDDASFNYYPNPVTDELTIDWTESDSNIELILIYNSLGELVMKKNVDQRKFSIDISTLHSGIYFIGLDKYRSNSLRFVKK